MIKKTGFEKVIEPEVRKDRTLPSNVWFCLCLWRDDSRPGILSGREVSNDWLIFILELFLNCTVASVNHELCSLSYCCLGAKSCLTLWTPWTVARQAPPSLLSPRVCANSCLLSQWCHPTISSSVAPFSFCLQSFPASGSSPTSWLFASGGQSNHLSTPSTNPQIPNRYYIQEVIFYSFNDPVS